MIELQPGTYAYDLDEQTADVVYGEGYEVVENYTHKELEEPRRRLVFVVVTGDEDGWPVTSWYGKQVVARFSELDAAAKKVEELIKQEMDTGDGDGWFYVGPPGIA